MLVARCSQRRRRPDRRPREARTWAATCANCHGVDGQARGDLIKPLAGMPAERLITALAGFKSGALPATVMHQIARGYSDEQVRAIAAYYAAQPAAR
jgi:cytochrome c553